MKFVAIGDIHLYPYNDFSHNIQCCWNGKRYQEDKNGTISMNSRLYNILSALCDVRDYCTENAIDLIANAGDTFHKRGVIDVETFNYAHRVFESISEAGITMLTISGNHDQAAASKNPESSVYSFKEYMEVFEKPEIFEYNDSTVFVMIPWTKDKKQTLNFISRILKHKSLDKDYILVAHLGISGGLVGSGNFVMSDEYNLNELNALKFKSCIFGHYHKPQILCENSIYTGSLLQNNFNDEGDVHGFWVIDTSKRWDLQMFPLYYPEFITLTSEDVKTTPEDVIQDNYTRIQVKAKDAKDVLDTIEDTDGVRLEIEREYKKSDRSKINVSMSQIQLVETYVKENRVNIPDSIKSEVLIEKGMDILRKVGEQNEV
jgi:DNA repair exonuclease SbcCD nuclease subunit